MFYAASKLSDYLKGAVRQYGGVRQTAINSIALHVIVGRKNSHEFLPELFIPAPTKTIETMATSRGKKLLIIQDTSPTKAGKEWGKLLKHQFRL